MSPKHGTENIKQVITTVKLASIAMIQKLPDNGVSGKTLTAPLSSPTFMKQLEEKASSFVASLPEISDLDTVEKLQIAKHTYDAWCDVKLEWSQAMKKIKAKKEQASTPA